MIYPRRIVSLAAACLSLVFLVGQAEAELYPDGFNPDGYPTAGCFWTGPFTADNPVTNSAYPGTHITYWGSKFRTPEGAVLTLRGRFPHARYSSFNAYEAGGVPTNSLPDRQIKPDRGSINTSLPGADRNARNRSYKVRVLGRPVPERQARNTLYAAPVEGNYQDVLYRVYVADRKRNLAGGVGLPVPVLTLADGTELKGKALCRALNTNRVYEQQGVPKPVYDSLVNTPGKDPLTNPALPKFEFARFFNLPVALAQFGSEEHYQNAWAANPNEVPNLYANDDASYMTGPLSFRYGELLVLTGSLPTTPETYRGGRRTRRGQLAEWDLCSIQSPVTTDTYRCLFDEQIPVSGKKRRYTIVVSKKENRPRNARRQCGVAWLPADPAGDGAGRIEAGLLMTRNVLPARNFSHSIQRVSSPFTAAREMGRFYPKGVYESKAHFEKRGC